ncbi:MAG: hypothetical protein AAFV33_00010 [Chloroflexota bacterium]
MAADFKSHVLRRDEKGVFGVPFKRLLLAGVGAGLTYATLNMVLALWSLPVAGVVGLLTIILTGPRGGIPLWNRLVYRGRGTLVLLAVRHPRGLAARVTDLLNLPTDRVRLNGARVFAPPTGQIEVDLREWITFAHAGEEDGLVFVDAPLKEGMPGE